jgi:hypothetical protein
MNVIKKVALLTGFCAIVNLFVLCAHADQVHAKWRVLHWQGRDTQQRNGDRASDVLGVLKVPRSKIASITLEQMPWRQTFRRRLRQPHPQKPIAAARTPVPS